MNGWRNGALVAALVAGVTIARTAVAGGYALIVNLPQPEDDARLQGCVLTYRAYGCHAANGTLTATFEGLVDGKRVSLPVEKVTTPIYVPHKDIAGWGTYGITRPNLPEGKWVLSLVAKSPTTYAEHKDGKPTGRMIQLMLTRIVPLQADGTPITRANPGSKTGTTLVAHSIAFKDKDKTIAQLLNKPATPTTVATSTPR